MTITTDPSRATRQRGFTLTEVMIGMALASLIATAVFASWGLIARSTVSIANYTEMNSNGRRGLETFARDIRMARDIRDFSSSGLTLIMDDDGEELIHYDYDSANQVVRREADDETEPLFRNVDTFMLTRFALSRREATNDLETKQIQLELSMVRPTLRHETTKKIVSARYIMRNKKMTQ